MKVVNIFCILAKTGAGKTEYVNRILNDQQFMKENNLSLLVYGTTRSMRENEKEGIDYYYHSMEDYNKITNEELIESRSYYTLNDGEVYYFTKTEYFQKETNIICIASPYQYESYKSWCTRENIKGAKYNLNAIIINTDLKVRIDRLIKRASKDEDIYEMCRRIIQERNEFDDVGKRILEISNPDQSKNGCYVDNTLHDELNKNIKKIKGFIRQSIK